MIKFDSVSEQTGQAEQREGYVFHCHNCGLYLDGIVAYHSPCVPIKFKMCPMCGEEEDFDG